MNWGGTAGTILWAFGDGQGATTLQANHAYVSAGTKTVTAVLTNGEAEAATIGPVSVQVNTPPIALLGDFNPVAPLPGVDVLFTSESADPDGDAVTHAWDFGDGITSPNRNPLHAFGSAGTKTVTLTVSDPFGASDTATEDVPVVAFRPPDNKAPVARFVYTPRSPLVGDEIDLASNSVDPEDALREQRWDLDGDGEFDDARGDEVIHSFTKPGTEPAVASRGRRREGCRGGTDHQGGEGAPVPQGYLLPPPGIVLTATILPTGVRVQDLTVQAPRGSLIRVTCRGRSCGPKQRRKRSKGRLVHFKAYRHFLRAGVRLGVYVTKPGLVGTTSGTRFKPARGPRAFRAVCAQIARSPPSAAEAQAETNASAMGFCYTSRAT